ncbi:hypothetical protein ABFX02_05G042500 [Erythranthe guttata]
MAANRFATMLHRNTNKITLVLTYAVLEWILISLLLLNSLFSYLIVKFAEFFGLKPPCPWCTRIDHIIDPAEGNKNMHRDLLCEVHSKEISRLGYCSNHQNLVDSQNLCEDCLSSVPDYTNKLNNFALFPCTKGFGGSDKEKVGENGEVSLNCLNCSCCGVSLDCDKYSSYILLKTSSWDVLECAQKENYLINDSDEKLSDFAEGENETKGDEVDLCLEEEKGTLIEENSTLIMKDKSVQVCVEEDAAAPVEIFSEQHLEFFLDYSGNRLVPIELIDSVTEEHKSEGSVTVEDEDKNLVREFRQDSEVQFEEKEELFVGGRSGVEKFETFIDVDINEEPKYTMLESMEIEEDENSLVFHANHCRLMTGEFADFRAFPLARWPSQEATDVQEMAGSSLEMHLDVHTDNVACEEEEVAQSNNENEADVSIGTEIPDLDITDEMQIQDSVHSYDYIHEDPSTNPHRVSDHDTSQFEEHMKELQSLSVQNREDHITNNNSSFHLEINEPEEDKVPDTPTSTDSFSQLHKKLLLLEKRDSGAEESLDGSVTSELEGSEGVVTVEGLKSALRSERKALQALYSELEEERSASAVAANQTMAMINRLQEEKAAMQMEALQYQRMMEEQSEYDQEALQLLNELMVKREREKQELEKEMEIYRKKLFDYETKEKIRVLRRSKDGSTRSGFSSDSDGLSIDLNHESKEEDGFYSNLNTPVDDVINLEESLADFEEERMSILDQLKVLEEKLSTLDDENAKTNGEANGHENGFSNHHQKRRIAGLQKGKSLLPLFDAIFEENGDTMNENGNGNENENGFDSYESNFEMEENKKLAIEAEIDHLYERLQALEADREFLKHCISSLKKGDKGMDLLQEILQHLRDLRNVEARSRNLGDSA